VEVELHPEARTELRAAALWYEERRAGLGDEFVSEISTVLARIGRAGESYPRWPGTERASGIVRKATVRRFPYLVAFEIHAEDALVLAVAHAKRRPLYWLARASQAPGQR
jgi:plasmid stabilization system protein ParE